MHKNRGLIQSIRDDHYLVCRLDIRWGSGFANGYENLKTAFKREPGTDPDIQNAFIDVSRIQAFGKCRTLHNHSFIIFRSIFSAFCAMTPSLSMVQSLYHSVIPFPLNLLIGHAKFASMNLFLMWQDEALSVYID